MLRFSQTIIFAGLCRRDVGLFDFRSAVRRQDFLLDRALVLPSKIERCDFAFNVSAIGIQEASKL